MADVYAIIWEGEPRFVSDLAPFRTQQPGGAVIQHPRRRLSRYSPEQRAAYGIYTLTVPDPLPGQVEIGRSLSIEAGAPILSVTYQSPSNAQIEADETTAIDAERDARQQADFVFDFGATPALDDAGSEIEAGARSLQMRAEDQDNWTRLHALALAAVLSGAPATILPMRAEDNWNVQTTAAQVLQVFAAGSQRNATLLFFAGALKSAVRAALAADDIPTALAVRQNAVWPA